MKSALKTLPSGNPAFNSAGIADALPDAVLVVVKSGDVVYSNLAAQAFLNMGAKAVASRNIAEHFGDTHPVTGALASFYKTGQPRRIQQDMETVSVVALDGFAMIVISRDIAEIRSDWLARIRHALKPAQHMARMLAHEIKNPLAGIRGAAQLLVKSGLGTDDRELAMLIDGEAARVLRMIEKVNVLDGDAGVFAPVNIHEVITHVLKIVPVESALQFDPSLPDIEGDRDRLVQAFLNIAKNAAEAGARKITVRTFYASPAAFHPETGLKLPLTVEIEDDGHGMDADTRARIFDPYYTTKPTGEGLGLSIVSKIIDDHNGIADVESRAGKTVFRFLFPRSPQ